MNFKLFNKEPKKIRFRIKKDVRVILGFEIAVCVALVSVLFLTSIDPVNAFVLTAESEYSTPDGVVNCEIASDENNFEVSIQREDEKTKHLYKSGKSFEIEGLKSGENSVSIRSYENIAGIKRKSPQVVTKTVILKPTPQKIDIKKSSIVLRKGKSTQLECTAETSIKYEVKDPSIASIDKDGKINAVKTGKTVIKVTAVGDGYYEETCKNIKLTVKPEMTPNELAIERACAWAIEQAKLGKYMYAYYDESTVCPICNPTKGIEGWNCIGFVSAAFHHGAKVNIECSNSGLGDDAMFETKSLSKWRAHNGPNWDQISASRLTESDLKKGDVLVCFSGGSYQHLALYIGDGKIADCNGGTVNGHRVPQKQRMNIQVRSLSDLDSTPKLAYRYTGK